jgi:hypothetical protein
MKPALLRLPRERALQLKALAKVRSITMTELIAGLINDAIAAGELPDQVPGFWVGAIDVQNDSPVIKFEMDGKAMQFLPAGAREVADALEAAVRDPAVYVTMPGQTRVTVQRQGSGIAIVAGLEDKVRRVVAPSIAGDLARQLRRAATAAEKTRHPA